MTLLCLRSLIHTHAHAERVCRFTSGSVQKLTLLEVWESIKMVDCSAVRHCRFVCRYHRSRVKHTGEGEGQASEEEHQEREREMEEE